MPEYRIRQTGEAITNLNAAFPNASIPLVPSMDDLDVLGVDPVLESPQPTVTRFQSVYRDGVEQINGKWFTKYAVADWDEAAIEAATKQQWDSIRADRDRRLQATDWLVAVASEQGKTVNQEVTAYRQALRDITKQEDPFNITWPEYPANTTPQNIVSLRQVRIALRMRGLFDTVENAINSIQDPLQQAIYRESWENSNTVQLTHPTTEFLRAVLGLSVDEARELEEFAATIP